MIEFGERHRVKFAQLLAWAIIIVIASGSQVYAAAPPKRSFEHNATAGNRSSDAKKDAKDKKEEEDEEEDQENKEDDSAPPSPEELRDLGRIENVAPSSSARERAQTDRRLGSFGTRLTGEKSISELSPEELRKEGYIFDVERKPLLSSLPVRVALFGGPFVNGVGLLTAGQTGTGLFVLGWQLLGIGLLVTGYVLPQLVTDSLAVDYSSMVMFAFGTTFLSSGYLLDVSGTLRSQNIRLGRLKGRVKGLTAGVGYRLVLGDSSPVSHVIDLDILYEHRWFFAKFRTLQDVQLNYQSYDLEVGSYPVRSNRETSYFGVVLHTKYSEFRGLGEYREIGGGAKLVGVLDLGVLFDPLQSASFGIEVGWEMSHPYLLDNELQFTKTPIRHAPYLFMYTNFAVSDAFSFRLGYRRNEDPLVVPSPSPAGVFVTEFDYRTEQESDLSLGFDFGVGFSLWLKGRINFFN